MAGSVIPAPQAAKTEIDITRIDVVKTIKSHRRLVRILIFPQVAMFFVLVLLFSGISVWGVIHSIMETTPDLSNLKSLTGYITTGSSGILGAVVLPMFKRLQDMTKTLIDSEKNHAKALTIASSSDTKAKIISSINSM